MPRPSIDIGRLNNLNMKPGTLRMPMTNAKVGKMVMKTILKELPKPVRKKTKKPAKKMMKKVGKKMKKK